MNGSRRLLFGFLLFVLVVFGLPGTLWAFTPNFSWSTGTFFQAGQVRELVFTDPITSTLTSRLEWPIPATAGLCDSFTARWLPWLDTKVSAAVALASTNGTMTDQDWNISGLITGTNVNALSTWSQTNLDESEQIDLSVGFPLKNALLPLEWRPEIGFLYRRQIWSAWGPSQTVATSISNPSITQTYPLPSGVQVRYTLQSFITYLGLEASFHHSQGTFGGAIDGSVFPFYQDQDFHIPNGYRFVDNIFGGFWLRPHIYADWHTLWGNWRLSVSYELSRYSRGNTYQTSLTSYVYYAIYPNDSGSESDIFTMALTWSPNS
ncbi:MAG: omptin family outer membrane protease [Spirochaetales bacterium]|nr:omptin family outer membrane protease [Spirochaetales bacterium]